MILHIPRNLETRRANEMYFRKLDLYYPSWWERILWRLDCGSDWELYWLAETQAYMMDPDINTMLNAVNFSPLRNK